jgi:tetratricopeptide (TPR) repeat protein
MVHSRFFRRTMAVLCFSATLALAQSGPQNTEQQYYAEGQRALQAGRYAEAEAAYEQLRKLDPGMAEIHANLGLIYFQERKFDRAVPALRQALKLKPGLPKVETLLAMSLSELGHYREAVPGLEKGFRQSGDSATRRMCGLQLERAYTGLQLDRKAVEVALELDRLYPNDPEVLYHDGKIFGNFAFLNMQKLADVAPASVWRHQAEAEAFESQGSTDAAISEYKQVLKLEPRRPGVHYRLGKTLLERSKRNNAPDDVTEAVKEFLEELQIDPSNGNAAYEVGEIHRGAGNLELAQKFFTLALEHHPDFEEAQLGLAAVLTSLHRPQEALPHVQKAVELRPGNEVSWYRLAQVEGMLGHDGEQRKAFAQFQKLHNQESQQKEAAKQLFSGDEVTQQTLDASPDK